MTSKTTNVLYWIFTILFAGLMALSAVPNLLKSADSIKLIHDQLGYPVHFIPFLGLAKLIGVVVILIPGLKKAKEWAYAGLFFDLIAVVYSGIAVAGHFEPAMLGLLGWIVPGIISYLLWSKKNPS